MAISYLNGKRTNPVPRSTRLSEALAGETQPSANDDADSKRLTRNTAPGMIYESGRRGPQQMHDLMLTSDEVQNVINQNAANLMNGDAAQAAALQLDPNGLSVSGMGQAGKGNWYSLIGPGGQVNPNNAALFAAMNPGPYNSPYAPAMQNLMNQLLNPKGFNYDVNADGLYQQIKDQYTKAGRQAMMDTQGQSAALTGGYGNSYGAQAGQQAYQESLGGLAGMIPELQQLAYQQYLNGEDAKRNNLEALNKLNEQDYSKWMDDMAAYMEVMKTVMANRDADAGGGNYDPTGSMTLGKPGENNFVLPWASGNNNTVNPDTVIALQKAFAEGTLNPYQMQTATAMGTQFPGIDQNSLNYATMAYTGNDPNGNYMAVPWAANNAAAAAQAPAANTNGGTANDQRTKNQKAYQLYLQQNGQ